MTINPIAIPITDLKRQYTNLKQSLNAAIQQVCDSGQFIKGPILQAFEEKIAAYLGVKYAIGVNSGTDALFLALKALGIGPGDEVITSAMSYIATAEAISLTGASPIFVDIQMATGNLDVKHIEAAITPQTKALLPVHLHGYPCQMQEILDLAKQFGLYLVEDCAQAMGAEFGNKKLGSLGDMGCFSFFPTKNLGCFGDGGLIATSNQSLYQEVLLLREHGCKQKNIQLSLGFNSRLDSLQAGILNVKLDHLDRWNKTREELTFTYNKKLKHLPIDCPPDQSQVEGKAVFHHYCLMLKHDRAWIQEQMTLDGIECIAYYPRALHQQKLYLNKGESLPQAEHYAQSNLALPLFPELTASELDYIVQTFEKHLLKLEANS